jgi:phosphate transport system substrate-binding protein
MKSIKTLVVLLSLCVGLTSQAADKIINGAGATFPYPVYSQWAYEYNGLTGVKLNYQSIGSGGGIKQIKEKTVDFGASDAPLDIFDLESSGLMQFPLVMGGVVCVVNLEGVKAGTLKLTGDLIAKIFLGEITNWNDPAIKAINTITLPDQQIAVVHRSDGSGTTWIFTNYLMKVSKEWETKVGSGKDVAWPTGLGGKGNEGVAAYVGQIKGSIGYVEYAYALQNELTHTQIQNQAGKFVQPTIESFQAASANADWVHAPGFNMVLTNQPGEASWPITGASFILMHRNQPDANKAKMMLDFFDWCYKNGADAAVKLHYVPIPESVVKLVQDAWKKEIKVNNQNVW